MSPFLLALFDTTNVETAIQIAKNQKSIAENCGGVVTSMDTLAQNACHVLAAGGAGDQPSLLIVAFIFWLFLQVVGVLFGSWSTTEE
jgi:hypothetical protein